MDQQRFEEANDRAAGPPPKPKLPLGASLARSRWSLDGVKNFTIFEVRITGAY